MKASGHTRHVAIKTVNQTFPQALGWASWFVLVFTKSFQTEEVNGWTVNQKKDPKSYWKIFKGNRNSDAIPIELEDFYEHFESLSV